MVFNSEVYIKLVNEKLTSFQKKSVQEFNKINGIEEKSYTENAKVLHYLKLTNREIDYSKFNQDVIKEEAEMTAEETSVINKLLNKEYKVFTPSEEDLTALTVTLEEVAKAMLTEEQHSTLLKDILSEKV